MLWNYHVELSKAQGAPVEIVYLPSNVANMNTVGLVRGAPHPNAGKLLIDFILGVEGQQILADAGYIPANPAVVPPAPILRPDTGNFTADLVTFEEYEEGKDHWTELYHEFFE